MKAKTGPGFAPQEIIFASTDICNLNCAHCYVKRKNHRLSVDKAIEFLKTTHGEITHIGFSGGEPFLYPEFLVQLTKTGIDMDLIFDSIMTNGVWWNNKEQLYSTLQSVYDAGYDGKIGISFDAFHGKNWLIKNNLFPGPDFTSNKTPASDFQPYIDKISQFCQAVFDIWQDNTMIMIQSVISSNKEEDFIKNEKSIEKILPPLFNYQIYRFGEAFESDNPKAWQDKKWFKEDFCQGPGQILYVLSNEKISPCCGFANENHALIIGTINDSFDKVMENAKINKMVKLCYETGLSSKLKEIQKNQPKILKGKTKENCTFCDFICKHPELLN